MEMITSNVEYMNDRILAGVDITMYFLGSSVLSGPGTDEEIASIIQEIRSIYGCGKRGIFASNKAQEVEILVDSQRIIIYAKTQSQSAEEVLFSFSLAQVRDVSACVNEGPYSNTCVLVAKDIAESCYKAYVFYSKNKEKAAEFYQVTSSAFELGYDLLETFGHCHSELREGNRSGRKTTELQDTVGCDTVGCDTVAVCNNNIEQVSIKNVEDCNIYEDMTNEVKDQTIQSCHHTESFNGRRTTTVSITPPKLLDTDKENTNLIVTVDFEKSIPKRLRQSKISLYVERVEERSRFLLPRWFRNSYKKFQKVSGKYSSEENEEDIVTVKR